MTWRSSDEFHQRCARMLSGLKRENADELEAMTDLAGFLLARIGEDEAVARKVVAAVKAPDYVIVRVYEQPEPGVTVQRDVALYRPDRVLAECEAKRRIVEECGHTVDRFTYSGDLARAVLALLALPYADHPDYRQEWKP